MKHRKRILSSRQRSLRACIYTALTLLGAAACYWWMGSPSLTAEHDFRRLERANMVGPSKIVDTLSHDEYGEFEQVIVGETLNGILFYTVHELYGSNLYYREKAEDITVLAAPTVSFGNWGNQYQKKELPIYLFTKYPNAVSADLEITVSGTWIGYVANETVTEDFSRSYTLSGTKHENGYFLFWIEIPEAQSNGDDSQASVHRADGFAPQYLSMVCHGISRNGNHQNGTIPATIRLYDKNHELILEKEFTVCSPSAEAHLEHGDPIE